jgi:biopolymer transport protein ExbD
MAAFNKNSDEEVISSINIIPFVDIVLVLLIIFMVTSTAIVNAAIKVELPKAANAGTAVEKTVNLVYTAERQLFLDGEDLPSEEVARRIGQQAAVNPELQAVISADKGLPYGDVVKLIDLVKASGVAAFALNIERAQPTRR